MLKVVLRLQSASSHKGIGDAHGGGVSERNTDVEIIILLHKGILNDVEHIPLMLVPVFVSKLGGDTFKLVGKAIPAGHIIIALQHGRYGVCVLCAKLP